MYAIIETGGKQYWVIPGETIKVERLEAKEGDKLKLKALWAAEEGGDGKKEPSSTLKGTVTAEVVRHLRGPKIIVFKKKAKARYVRKIGHRQNLTEIRINEISLN